MSAGESNSIEGINMLLKKSSASRGEDSVELSCPQCPSPPVECSRRRDFVSGAIVSISSMPVLPMASRRKDPRLNAAEGAGPVTDAILADP